MTSWNTIKSVAPHLSQYLLALMINPSLGVCVSAQPVQNYVSGLITAFNPVLPLAPEWCTRDCDGFQGTQPKVRWGWPFRDTVLPTPSGVSSSGVIAGLAVQIHSAFGRNPSDDASPGSWGESKAAASCSLVWQRWPTAFLPSWLTDCCGGLVSDRHV